MKVKDVIYGIALLILLSVIILDKCSPKRVEKTVYKNTVSDTTYKDLKPIVIHDSIYRENPTPSKTIIDTLWERKNYVPSGHYDMLRNQYEVLGQKYFSSNIYNRHFDLDTSGTVDVVDTVKGDTLVGTKFVYKVNIHTKLAIVHDSTTIIKTISSEPVRQVFIGGGITGNTKSLFNSAYIGLLLKNKKDQVYELGVQQPFDGSKYSIKFGTYIKIHL